METCVLCNEDIENGKAKVTIKEKGSQGINKASKKRGEVIHTSPGDVVHQHCLRAYCNPKAINLQLQREQEDIQNNPVLRSSNIFQFSEQCIFCEQSAVLSENKRKNDLYHDVYPVRTKDFQRNVEEICKQRGDEWSLYKYLID